MSMYGVPYSALEPGKGAGAKQSMLDECDVNLIVERFAKTGLLEHIAEGIPQYVDASELGDFRSVLEQVRKVEDYFSGLPAAVRSSFQNDAARFMDYLESGASAEDLQKLGLAIVGDRRADEERQRRREDAAPKVDAVPVAPEEPSTVST